MSLNNFTVILEGLRWFWALCLGVSKTHKADMTSHGLFLNLRLKYRELEVRGQFLYHRYNGLKKKQNVLMLSKSHISLPFKFPNILHSESHLLHVNSSYTAEGITENSVPCKKKKYLTPYACQKKEQIYCCAKSCQRDQIRERKTNVPLQCQFSYLWMSVF